MARRLNLHRMLGLSSNLRCPRCGAKQLFGLEDYDVEQGDPNPSHGQWCLHLRCERCEHCEFEFDWEFSLAGSSRSFDAWAVLHPEWRREHLSNHISLIAPQGLRVTYSKYGGECAIWDKDGNLKHVANLAVEHDDAMCDAALEVHRKYLETP